jgi:urease accessory protein
VTHPLFGPDHLVAMLAVGLWGAQLGNPSLWVLPVTFPLIMAVGGFLGVIGVELPLVETVIELSALVLGGMVVLALRSLLWIAGATVTVFGPFHGNAHGLELPAAADPRAYVVGFVLATGLIRLAGITFGRLHRWPAGAQAVRAGGALVAAMGIWLLLPGGAGARRSARFRLRSSSWRRRRRAHMCPSRAPAISSVASSILSSTCRFSRPCSRLAW